MRLVAAHDMVPVSDASRIADPSQPRSRSEVAAYLGMAADAIAAALRRWENRPFAATGRILQQAERDLDEALPSLRPFLPIANPIWQSLADAHDGVRDLSLEYFAGRLPTAGDAIPYLLSGYAYNVRQAQAVLVGIDPGVVNADEQVDRPS